MNCAHEHDHRGFDQTMGLLKEKWTVEMLHHIIQGRNRFGVLHRTMKGISPKTLAFRLRQLEAKGILTRRVYAEVPPHTEYAVTAKGRSLHRVIEVMDEWGRD